MTGRVPNMPLGRSLRTGNEKLTGAGEKLLLAVSSPDCNFNAVSSLIPVCTKEELNRALAKAAENGHLDVVQELVPVSDVGAVFQKNWRAFAPAVRRSFILTRWMRCWGSGRICTRSMH
ncbi:MAG: hypothetical protein JNN30_05325 [Rhodanobacteraceae bacterium]|nr:hypothetical protein [Rhodanobacteraceae bacterium]